MNIASQKNSSDDFEKLVYLLSHDVRNSARALVDLPEWIREDLEEEGHTVDGSLGENIDLMRVQARRLDRMLSDLLVYSRVGRMQTVEPVALSGALKAARANLSMPDAFEIEEQFEQAEITMGATDARTLFEVLLSNAVKHHHRDCGRITVSSRSCQGECRLRVSDDGPGIAEKNHTRVFEPMTTLQPRDVIEGSGMGLAIARKIVTLYGGRIAVLPTADAPGTVIDSYLPV